MSNRFTDKAERALNSAVKCAESFGHSYIGSEHILLSLAEVNDSVASVVMAKYSVTAEKIKKAIRDYSGSGLRSTLTPKDMTPCSKKIIESSYRISIRYTAQKIGTEHILLALIEEKESVAMRILAYMGADVAGITDEVHVILRCIDRSAAKQKDTKESVSPLRQHGRSLTDMARSSRLDPIIGRDAETDRLIRVLCRKNKNNPCLIGEAGVGKTAIVEGLAQRIVEGKVPETLKNKEIICVDLTAMVSGTKYRGDFEERIKSVINEAAKNKNIILFIDEIHTIVGAGAAEGAIDAANILKPQLSRAELQLIGATTFAEYRKYIERDSALERRFQPITVEEASCEDAQRMLMGLRGRYELHHNVRITDEAIAASVEYSVRYIQDRYLPDKALDVLDEACAKASAERNEQNMQIFEHKLRQIKGEKEDAIMASDFVLAKNLKELELGYEVKLDQLRDMESTETPVVDERAIKEIIHEITGIPIVGIGEKIKREQLYNSLSSKILGQEKAIGDICDAILRAEYGITSPERPKGFYLFVGSSGVGKTELAKAISEALFFDKGAFFKLDMSEYSEPNSVTKLIGSPPGYAGHDEGGALTEKVRRHPYSIILFDEIEKAHTDVLDLFLQIADNGYLCDSSGRHVSFRNTYVIMTSNVSSGIITDKAVGFLSSAEHSQDKIGELLSKSFRIEFINRLDEIILFSPIDIDAMQRIAEKKLGELCTRLSRLGYEVKISDGVTAHLAERSLDKKFGVRKLLRIISREIENKLSLLISESKDDVNVEIALSEGNIVLKMHERAEATK
ncbi:MAG: ATP-dependent Clp protease ATP-binding subunit [Clostridia bacterium]|nr:ATP-dependent Clp protease ATP-binding subunit [Clostridia bacterium]